MSHVDEIAELKHSVARRGQFTTDEQATIEFLISHSRVVLGDSAGIHQTMEIAAVLALLKANARLDAALLITASDRRIQWCAELALFAPSLEVEAPGLVEMRRFASSGNSRINRIWSSNRPDVTIWTTSVACRAGVPGLFSTVIVDDPGGLHEMPVNTNR